jgi:hypothetical protein
MAFANADQQSCHEGLLYCNGQLQPLIIIFLRSLIAANLLLKARFQRQSEAKSLLPRCALGPL